MGMLVDGHWSDLGQEISNGAYVRMDSVYANDISDEIVVAMHHEPGRFLLIVSLTCPWSHRTMIVRQLKKSAGAIRLHIASGKRVQGYSLSDGESIKLPGLDEAIVHLHQLYSISHPGYTGSVTVPVLWDCLHRRIVSNESAKIMRALDAVPNADGEPDFTLTPPGLLLEIDELNNDIYVSLNNGVYRAGFAQDQDVYEQAVDQVFSTLDKLELRLSNRRYLCGSILSEADWRLFPTLVRFDSVYYLYHLCSRKRLVDYPNLWAYARDLYAWRGVAETVDFDAIRRSSVHDNTVNKSGHLLAVLPEMDWHTVHKRENLGPACLALRSGEVVEVEPPTLKLCGL